MDRRTLLGAAAGGLSCASLARDEPARRELVFAYQSMPLPLRQLIDSGELQRSTGYTIQWRAFATGGDVIRAMATGGVQIGEAGSASVAVAASQGQDIRLFWILADLSDAEALVARPGSGIARIGDLRGRRVGVPALSTAHYQLLAGLQSEGVDVRSVRIVHLRPAELAEAWASGTVDAAFVWPPVLNRLLAHGNRVATARSLADKGFRTFDGLVVDAAWASANEGFMVELVKAVARLDNAYRQTASKWTAQTPAVQSIAKSIGAQPEEVPEALALYHLVTVEEQASHAWLGGGAAQALAHTAALWQAHGRVLATQPDYRRFVDARYVNRLLGR